MTTRTPRTTGRKKVTKLALAPEPVLNPLAAVEKRIAEASSMFDIEHKQVTRILPEGGGAANGDGGDMVVFSGTAELQMRRLIAAFCFPRLPQTWAEYIQVLEYCENLWAAAGGGVDPKYHKNVQKAARQVDMRRQPWRVPAFDLYVVGDWPGLLALHTRDKTMEYIAKSWQEYMYPEGHPLFEWSIAQENPDLKDT